MGQVLSQSEIDVLLESMAKDGLKKPEPSTQDSALGKKVRPYSLLSQDKIIRGRLPRLDIIYGEWTRSFQSTLLSTLKKRVNINYVGTEFVQFGNFIKSLSIPTCMNIFEFKILHEWPSIIVFEKQLVYNLVDGFLGGRDRPYTKNHDKKFTSIELSIVEKSVKLAIKDLERIWSFVENVHCEFVKIETDPHLLGAIPSDNVVVLSKFVVKFENMCGMMTLLVPYVAFESIKQKLSSKFTIDTNKKVNQMVWRTQLEEHLFKTDVEFKVDLGVAVISLQKLMHMRVGDVIPLDQRVGEECDVQIEKINKYKACYGTHRGIMGVQVKKITNK